MARNGTWPKGQSGNPRGRAPKGQTVAELLRAIGDLAYRDTQQTMRQRAATVIWQQACAGNLDALKWIVERTEGKVPDKLDATVNQRTQHVFPEETVDAVLESYAARRLERGGPRLRPVS